MKKWNEIVMESKESEDFSSYLSQLKSEFGKERSKQNPDSISMYREKLKSLGRKMGLDNKEIDARIEEAYKSAKK